MELSDDRMRVGHEAARWPVRQVVLLKLHEPILSVVCEHDWVTCSRLCSAKISSMDAAFFGLAVLVSVDVEVVEVEVEVDVSTEVMALSTSSTSGRMTLTMTSFVSEVMVSM